MTNYKFKKDMYMVFPAYTNMGENIYMEAVAHDFLLGDIINEDTMLKSPYSNGVEVSSYDTDILEETQEEVTVTIEREILPVFG